MQAYLINLKRISYEKGWKLQKKLVEARANEKILDTLILLEHNKVITLGRRGKEENILVSGDLLKKKKIVVCKTDRGGDVTFHCQGQLVGYLIFDLNNYNRNLYKFINNIEEVIIRTLKKYKLDGERINGSPGIWVEGKKIAFLGLAVKNCITFHGFSLNVNCPLKYFSYINPCGIKNLEVTSLKNLGCNCKIVEVKKELIKNFQNVFNIKLREINCEKISRMVN